MTKHQDPYCTNTDCKCFENGQQQELAAIVNYIKTQGSISPIPDNQQCEHGAYSWDGCETCYQTELIKQLIEGHHKTRRANQTNILSQ